MIIKNTNLNQRPTKWAIAGGGMLGLTLAMRMAKQGHDVTLIEAADRLGGLCLLYTSDAADE